MRKARGKHRSTVYREMGPLDKFQLKVVAVVATLQPLLTHDVCPSKPLLGWRRRGGNHEAIGNDRWKGTPVSSLRFPSAIRSFQGARKKGEACGGAGAGEDLRRTCQKQNSSICCCGALVPVLGVCFVFALALMPLLSDAKWGARVIPHSSLCQKKKKCYGRREPPLTTEAVAGQSCWAPGARAHVIVRRHWASAMADCAVPLLCPFPFPIFMYSPRVC